MIAELRLGKEMLPKSVGIYEQIQMKSIENKVAQ
jgi:hypothetical protein